MPSMSRASRATLRSQSGPQAAAWLTTVPTSPATTLSPVLFQICLRRRICLPFLPSNRRCDGCGGIRDALGDHRAACSALGRSRKRMEPIELAWSAVFAEARAEVTNQVLLRDTNLPVDPWESRYLDFVAWCRMSSRPICGDASTVSPLHRDEAPQAVTPDIDGASLLRALAGKDATDPELARQT